MGRPGGFFDLEERLAGLSKKGDDLERLAAVVDFEQFRPELERAVSRADRAKGGRPPFDRVLMFKVLILQTQNNLSDERTDYRLHCRRGGAFTADTQRIDTGGEGLHGAFGLADGSADRPHVRPIGHDDAVETEPVPKQAGHHVPRQCRRPVGVERGEVMWAVITIWTSAAIAARNGSSSRSTSTLAEAWTVGTVR